MSLLSLSSRPTWRLLRTRRVSLVSLLFVSIIVVLVLARLSGGDHVDSYFDYVRKSKELSDAIQAQQRESQIERVQLLELGLDLPPFLSLSHPSDPPGPRQPPEEYMDKYWEFNLARTRDSGGGVAQRDPNTGRPLLIPLGDLFGGGSEWELREQELEAHDFTRSGGKGGRKMPKVQFDFEARAARDGGSGWEEEKEQLRREWVKKAFVHAWVGYKKFAWGHDELRPVTNTFRDPFNSWGATIVDALDTLLIMNLSTEYNLARQHVADIDFAFLGTDGFSTSLPPIEQLELGSKRIVDESDSVNREPLPQGGNHQEKTGLSTFETIIRFLGGLISAYDLSGDPLMLSRATELGRWLLPVTSTSDGLARGQFSMGVNFNNQPGGHVLAEVGTLSMEFERLGEISGVAEFTRAARRTMDRLANGFEKETGSNGRLGELLPSYFSASAPGMLAGLYTVGAMSDSYYEYTIKSYQLTQRERYLATYEGIAKSIKKHLVWEVHVVPNRTDLAIVGEKVYGRFVPALTHLGCFSGGMFTLGGQLTRQPADVELGEKITNACVWAYTSAPYGLAPESMVLYEETDETRFETVEQSDGSHIRREKANPVAGVTPQSLDSRFMGRPETIESVFYLYRVTGDRKWQDRGWEMFVAWIKATMTSSGFTSLDDVYSETLTQTDTLESFVYAETFKYYYLLFSPASLISLDDYVFNTEAHPFKVHGSDRAGEVLWDSTGAHSYMAEEVGGGTVVQNWMRVQQARHLAHSL